MGHLGQNLKLLNCICNSFNIVNMANTDWENYCLWLSYWVWAQLVKMVQQLPGASLYHPPIATTPIIGPLTTSRNFVNEVCIPLEGALEWLLKPNILALVACSK